MQHSIGGAHYWHNQKGVQPGPLQGQSNIPALAANGQPQIEDHGSVKLEALIGHGEVWGTGGTPPFPAGLRGVTPRPSRLFPPPSLPVAAQQYRCDKESELTMLLLQPFSTKDLNCKATKQTWKQHGGPVDEYQVSKTAKPTAGTVLVVNRQTLGPTDFESGVLDLLYVTKCT